MIAKLATAVPTGAAVTLSLLFLMQALISMHTDSSYVPTPPRDFKWLHTEIVENLTPEVFEFPDIPEIEPTPDPRPDVETRYTGPTIGIPRTTRLPLDPRGDTFKPNVGDGPLALLMPAQPAYPPPAIARGLEGYVLVRFDVLPSGNVSNVVVLESSNEIFDRAAIAAAKKFRFKARVVDGVPLASTGVQYQFRFELEN